MFVDQSTSEKIPPQMKTMYVWKVANNGQLGQTLKTVPHHRSSLLRHCRLSHMEVEEGEASLQNIPKHSLHSLHHLKSTG